MLEFPVEPQSPPGCPFDPPPSYRELLDQPGLSKARIWSGTEAWLIARFDDYREVCRDFATFSSVGDDPNFPYSSAGAKPLSRSLVNADPPDHPRLRRLTAAFFAKRKMEQISPAIGSLADELLDEVEVRGHPADLVASYAKPIPSLIVFHLLGLPREERRAMHQLLDVLFGAKTPVEEVEGAARTFEQAVTHFVTTEGVVESDGLIATLRREAVPTGSMTIEELRDFVVILIVGGFESTANTIAEGIALLLMHPDQLDQVRTDEDLWPNAVEEIVRITSVTHRGRRRIASKECVFAEEHISRGDAVIALEAAANRDPRRFENPDTFDIRRSNARVHVGFGYGPHLCLGAPLARLELAIALKQLFRRFPRLQLAVTPDELDFMHDWHLRGLRTLPVTW
ncbi:MAG: cytochrome P450 [Acidimicrobiia bacterium]